MAVAGRAPSSIARAVSALRSFYRFLDSRGLARNAAIASASAPPVPVAAHPALSEEDALGALATIGHLSDEPWVAKRDAALFALLYGCGLRLGEALALDRDCLPIGETLALSGTVSPELSFLDAAPPHWVAMTTSPPSPSK